MSDFGSGLPPSWDSLDQGSSNDPAPNPDSLAEGFLKNIPETDRAIVAKYVKDWDAGVTRRFQKIHDEYRPYKSLGADPETLQSAWMVYQMIEQDPQQVYNLLAQGLGMSDNQGGSDFQQEQISTPQYEGLPPEFMQEWQQTQQMLGQVAQYISAQQQQQAQAAEDAQLDDYLNQLRDQYGDFDEDWVLSKMMKGMDGAQAVQAFHEFTQGIINSRASRRPSPPILGGGGATPNSGVDPRSLNRSDTRALVAQMLQASQEG